jgi:hypothetical protein
MTWAQAQAQLVSVIEGVTPTTARRGKASAFKHSPKSSAENGPNPESRGFWFVPKTIEFVGAMNASGVPPRMRMELDLVIFYVEDKEPAQNFEDLSADHSSVGRALLNPTARGTFSSTSLIGIGIGTSGIMKMTLEKVQGGYRCRTAFAIEYTEST